MLRLILFLVSGFFVSSVEMNCINPAAADSTVDTLYINSSDTIYRFDTVYSNDTVHVETLLVNTSDTIYRFDTIFSKDTVHVETLLVSRSVYIDTAGNSYSKMLAFKGRVGDLPFEVDSVIPAYQIRSTRFLGAGHSDTIANWYPDVMKPILGGIIDTVDTGTITYGHYNLETGVPIDSSWIIDLSLRWNYTSPTYNTQQGDKTRHSLGASSIVIYSVLRSWLPTETTPSLNSELYECVLASPLK